MFEVHFRTLGDGDGDYGIPADSVYRVHRLDECDVGHERLLGKDENRDGSQSSESTMDYLPTIVNSRKFYTTEVPGITG